MAHTIELQFVAPIPVGHRVEITWRQEPEPAGWIGSKKKGGEPIASKPIVRDVETGIIYGPLNHYQAKTSGYRVTDVRPLLQEPLPVLNLAGALSGRVLACRVLTQLSEGTTQNSGVLIIQTTLVVEPGE